MFGIIRENIGIIRENIAIKRRNHPGAVVEVGAGPEDRTSSWVFSNKFGKSIFPINLCHPWSLAALTSAHHPPHSIIPLLQPVLLQAERLVPCEYS